MTPILKTTLIILSFLFLLVIAANLILYIAPDSVPNMNYINFNTLVSNFITVEEDKPVEEDIVEIVEIVKPEFQIVDLNKCGFYKSPAGIYVSLAFFGSDDTIQTIDKKVLDTGPLRHSVFKYRRGFIYAHAYYKDDNDKWIQMKKYWLGTGSDYRDESYDILMDYVTNKPPNYDVDMRFDVMYISNVYGEMSTSVYYTGGVDFDTEGNPVMKGKWTYESPNVLDIPAEQQDKPQIIELTRTRFNYDGHLEIGMFQTHYKPKGLRVLDIGGEYQNYEKGIQTISIHTWDKTKWILKNMTGFSNGTDYRGTNIIYPAHWLVFEYTDVPLKVDIRYISENLTPEDGIPEDFIYSAYYSGGIEEVDGKMVETGTWSYDDPTVTK